MKNNGKNNSNIFCSHFNKSNSNKNQSKTNLYTYCQKCGSISINHNNHFYFTIKPIVKQKEIEIDPVQIVKGMIRYQNNSKPYLNNVFNLNLNEKATILQDLKERIFLYLSKRKLLLLYLQNITKSLNYSDLSFYHCLLLTDLYLSHNISKKMTDEELLYLLIGFFLISSKFKETDIFEPELYIFCNIDFDYVLTVDKILYYEAKCLKLIKYDFFVYSTYDWLNTFMGNGFVFEGEIDENNNEEINEIHSYSFKLLITITPKNIFIKYSPIHNAISIVQICREDKIDKNKRNNELFTKLLNIYGIKFQDYENCYNEIKETINKYNSEKNNKISNHNIQIHTLKRTENNKTLNEMNYEKNDGNKIGIININRTGKKVIKFDTQRKLNLKQKLRDNKFQINLFSSNIKPKKRFKSINLTNNNSNIKNPGLVKKQKTLQIVEYINENLPKLKNLGGEGDKVFQTETEITSGRNIKVLTIKNDIINNYLMKNKKNKSGTSLDVKIFYNNGKSPLGFNRLLRNITYDALKNNEGKITRKLIKNNTNLAAHQNKSKILNNSSDALKYFNTNENSNIKNNNMILELKAKLDNNRKGSNNNLNTYKNNSNIYNYNNRKSNFSKQNTSEYLKSYSNNIKIIKPEKSSLNDNNKNNQKEIEIHTKEIKENKNSSIDKNKDKFIKDKIINNEFINNKNKFILSNMKFNKSNLKNLNDLISLKKLLFKNQKLPKLKIKIDK